MAVLHPDIPPHIADILRHLPPDLKRSVKAAIRTLAPDPHAGDPLMKELQGLWKFRVKRFRIVYDIDPRRRMLRIVGIVHRRRIYEQLTDVMHHRKR